LLKQIGVCLASHELPWTARPTINSMFDREGLGTSRLQDLSKAERISNRKQTLMTWSLEKEGRAGPSETAAATYRRTAAGAGTSPTQAARHHRRRRPGRCP